MHLVSSVKIINEDLQSRVFFRQVDDFRVTPMSPSIWTDCPSRVSVTVPLLVCLGVSLTHAMCAKHQALHTHVNSSQDGWVS